jgi:pimeloyl-ACP methyl ester carboxylesterase
VRRLTSLVALFVLAAGAAACAQEADGTSLSDGSTTTNGDSDSGNSDSDSSADQIEWQSCDSFDCATVEVPLDYDEPDGDTIEVSVLRVPATGDRIGALFVNPGGPGGIATDFAAQAAYILPEEITEHFDIVGVDPRGTGASEIDCGGDFAELYGVDYSIDSDEDREVLLDVSQEYVDGCNSKVGADVLAHMGTNDVARDMDTVRELMGDDQMNYLGISYGTAIGQAYADLFPDKVRAMILDAVVEIGPSGADIAKTQAVGFERALDAFAADCDSNSDCPLAPDALAKVDELMAKVEQEPIPAEPRDLGPGDLSIGMAFPLYSESYWPDLADAVDDALRGDGSAMVQLADDYLGIASFDVYFAVNCLDFAWPDTPEELLADGAEAATTAPHFGPPIVNDYVRCAMWPVEAEPLEASAAEGAPPILVVSTTNDPATPYENGVNTAERLENGVLLTYEGEGHGAVLNGVDCIDEKVVKYLVDLEPPEDKSTCD